MAIIYYECHLIPRWLLRSTFTQFPEQLLNDLVSWGSPGEYCSARFGDCSANVVLGCRYNLKLQDHVASGAHFFNWGCVWVWPCSSWICGSTVYAIQDQVTPNAPIWCSTSVMCQCELHAVLWLHIGIIVHLLAAEPCSTIIPLSVSLWNDLARTVFNGVGLVGFNS